MVIAPIIYAEFVTFLAFIGSSMEYGSFVKKIFSRVFFLLITSCKTKKTRILSLRSQYVASKVQIVTDWLTETFIFWG